MGLCTIWNCRNLDGNKTGIEKLYQQLLNNFAEWNLLKQEKCGIIWKIKMVFVCDFIELFEVFCFLDSFVLIFVYS